MLRRYWIEFDKSPATILPAGFLLGCGVAARSREEALEIVQTNAFKNRPFPPLRKISEDVDVSTLDANHVLPNMSLCAAPGIWFPPGYRV